MRPDETPVGKFVFVRAYNASYRLLGIVPSLKHSYDKPEWSVRYTDKVEEALMFSDIPTALEWLGDENRSGVFANGEYGNGGDRLTLKRVLVETVPVKLKYTLEEL